MIFIFLTIGAVGVVIEKVIPDTEAERAGLEGIDYRRRTLGDVIVAVEGSPVANMDDFAHILQNFEIGQTITLEVRRGGSTARGCGCHYGYFLK